MSTPTADLRATETVSFDSTSPERLTLTVGAAAPGMLVLSEIYDPNWTATVDGVPTPIYPANHAFRAISIPAGSHVVELTYDPLWLRVGLIVTIATVLGVLGLLTATAWSTFSPRSRRPLEPADA